MLDSHHAAIFALAILVRFHKVFLGLPWIKLRGILHIFYREERPVLDTAMIDRVANWPSHNNGPICTIISPAMITMELLSYHGSLSVHCIGNYHQCKCQQTHRDRARCVGRIIPQFCNFVRTLVRLPLWWHDNHRFRNRCIVLYCVSIFLSVCRCKGLDASSEHFREDI